MASTVGAGSVGNALSELNAGATAGDAASGAGTLTALSYDDDRGGVVGRVVRTVDAFKSGLVGVLYIMAHRSVVSNTADAIYVSIGCIQLVSTSRLRLSSSLASDRTVTDRRCLASFQQMGLPLGGQRQHVELHRLLEQSRHGADLLAGLDTHLRVGGRRRCVTA